MIVSLKNKERVFKLSSLGLMFVFVTACTKEIPYKYQLKEEITNKTLIDENAEYLMVSSTGATSRTSEDRPFWMGETRIVKLKFEETELQVIEMEQDARFQDNATNNKVVMTIPVSHHQYRCAKDRNGQCTNQEEDASDISWKQKSSFKPDFANTSVKAADSSTVEFDKLFGESCFSETGSKTLGYQLEQDGLNIQLEKTYRINIGCISEIESWEELFTKTISTSIVHHSLVKLDTLTSKDFKARKYTQHDSNVFGFFDQTNKTLDVDLRPTLNSESMLMSHWNPNRSIIEYHLSDEFAKPENKAIKDATYKAFESLNDGLAKSGAKFRMKLNEPSGKQPGDIRYSMIVMVEDPIASGLLGYGPSVKNPRTGEIVSARTVMYPGVMHQQVMQTYNEIYHQKMAAQKSVKVLDTQLTVSPALLAKALTVKPVAAQADSSLTVAPSKAQVKVPKSKISSSDFVSGKIPKNLEKQIRSQKNVVRFSTAEIRQIQETDSIEMALDQKMKKELFKSRHCFYPAEMLTADSEMALNVEAALGEVSKPWHELSESEKKTVIAVILPQAWTQTLIHEVGHNLGLRHNFQGSEDSANFYTEQELADMGVQTKIPYSSVMDYGASSQSELPVLGKYDIAALRFAYAGQVEVLDKDGNSSLVSVPSTIEDLKKTLGQSSLKDYGFCTDDHADANAGCNRFDQGTNNVEMVQHMISEYKKRQFYLNRLDRLSFSIGNDHLYASGTSYRFFHIRSFIESYERMKEVLLGYNLDIEDPAVLAEYAFIKDIRDAAILAGQFLIDVVQTPDTTCAIALSANPNQIIAVLPLSDLDDSVLSCYDTSLNATYKVVAQAGKSFNSKKSPDSQNPFADQIDLRGIWSDKVIASRYILNRKLNHSSYDQRVDNLTDMPMLTQSVFDLYSAIGTNNLVAPAEFETPSGQKLTIPVQANLKAHLIKAPLYWYIARVIGVPNRESYLQETVTNHLVQAMVNSPLKINQSNVEYMDAFKVTTMSTSLKEDLLDSGVEYINFGSTRYVASAQNIVAKELIVSANNSNLLTRLGEEKVTELLDKKTKGEPIDITASVDEKKAFNLDAQVLTDFLQGSLPTVDASMTLLKLLPN